MESPEEVDAGEEETELGEKNRMYVAFTTGQSVCVHRHDKVGTTQNLHMHSVNFHSAPASLAIRKTPKLFWRQGKSTPVLEEGCSSASSIEKKNALSYASLILRRQKALAYFETRIPLVVGFVTGDILFLEIGRKRTFNYMHFNGKGNPFSGSVLGVAWIPSSIERFFVWHKGNSNVYEYDLSLGTKVVEISPSGDSFSVSENTKALANPFRLWNVCGKTRSRSAYCVSFSRDCATKVRKLRIFIFEYLQVSISQEILFAAAVGQKVYVWNYEQRRVIYIIDGYFGDIFTLNWSHDGQYLAFGGEADIISIFSVVQEAVVYICVGHKSWISSVDFDVSTSTGGSYVLASASQDTSAIFWRFDPNGTPSGKRSASKSNLSSENRLVNFIKHPSRETCDILRPISLPKQIHAEPLSDIKFTHSELLTACHGGFVKVWGRPSFNDAVSMMLIDDQVSCVMEEEKREPNSPSYVNETHGGFGNEQPSNSNEKDKGIQSQTPTSQIAAVKDPLASAADTEDWENIDWSDFRDHPAITEMVKNVE